MKFTGHNHQICRRDTEAVGGSPTPLEGGNYTFQGTSKSKLGIGNDLADREAKQAAKGEVQRGGALVPDEQISLEGEPKYTKEDQRLTEDLDGSYDERQWALTPQGELIIPSYLIWSILREEHKKRHWGAEALYNHLPGRIEAGNLYTSVKEVTQRCNLCLQTNPKNVPKPKPGQIEKGKGPGDQWQINFMELPRKKRYRYLLVLTDTFSGWPEPFPTRTARAREVSRILIQEIIPRFGVQQLCPLTEDHILSQK